MNRIKLLGIFALCLAASLYAAVRMFWCILVNPQRAWVMAVSHDQLANAATGGNPDETVSSRAFRAQTEGRRWGCVLCKVLDWVDKNHCRDSAGI